MHSFEIYYVFNTLGAFPNAQMDEKDHALATAMVTYWTNFAHTSDPNRGPLGDDGTIQPPAVEPLPRRAV
jgi:carboxylesterase type B